MRTITDHDFLSWEIYPSAGNFGYPDQPKVIFNCLTDPSRRGRYVRFDGDSAGAEQAVRDASDSELQSLLTRSVELD